MKNAKELRKALSNAIDWTAFFSLVANVGDELNERKLRFDKSDLFEQAVADFSGGTVEWVDKIGFDLIAFDKCRLEMKYAKGAMTTPKGKTKKKVKELKLVNTMGGGTSRELTQTFDYLIICDEISAAIVSFDAVAKHCKSRDDSIVLRGFPAAELMWLVSPGTIKPRHVVIEKPYRNLKGEMQRGYIRQFQ
jgi:hypothetical protein